MAKKEQKSGTAGSSDWTEGRERVLDEQKLVNEREDAPIESGGMARPPVDRHEPPVRPELGHETPRDELKPESRRPPAAGDIEREGS